MACFKMLTYIIPHILTYNQIKPDPNSNAEKFWSIKGLSLN